MDRRRVEQLAERYIRRFRKVAVTDLLMANLIAIGGNRVYVCRVLRRYSHRHRNPRSRWKYNGLTRVASRCSTSAPRLTRYSVTQMEKPHFPLLAIKPRRKVGDHFIAKCYYAAFRRRIKPTAAIAIP